MYRFLIAVVVIVFFSTSCEKDYITQAELSEQLAASELFLQSVENLTEVQIHDIFSPPVASRVYAYPCITAYEAMRPAYSEYESLAGQLNGLPSLEIESVDTTEINYDLAGLYAFNEVGKQLIFSEEMMEEWQAQVDSVIISWNVNPQVMQSSKDYAGQVKTHVMAWAKKDNYDQTRTMPKFSVTDEPSRWKPTPPAYIEGIEPHWNKMRPMVIDSAAQFRLATTPIFDLTEGSDFYKLVEEVYEVGNNLDDDQRQIASFWDCNPFVMNQTGHIMFATKKITPGGHWMGITGVACRKANVDLMATVHAHTMVTLGLFDAFITCWDEKYRSALIRPETVINEEMDPDWLPALQTPPFPEHTSGHSVISTASAVILTAIFGDDFAFTDDVEVRYGLPERSFNSFIEASQEAAISRLYGGIHYRPAIEDGVVQGRQVGNFIVDKVLSETGEGISGSL